MKYKLSIIFLITSLFVYTNVLAVVEARDSKATTAAGKELTFSQIKNAAESGDADAQYALGYLYFYGKNGAPKDSDLAKTWISKAANQKQPQAIKALALMNSRSQNMVKENTRSVATQQISTDGVEQGQEAHAPQEQIKKVDVSSDEKSFLTKKPKSKDDDQNIQQSDSKKGLYTLQLLGASDKDKIRKLVEKHHLGDKAKLYQTMLKGKDWYVLTYGQFKTRTEAQIAAKKLENELALTPWVKPYSSNKQERLISIFN